MVAGCGISFGRVKEGGRGECFCSVGWEGVAVIVVVVVGIPLSRSEVSAFVVVAVSVVGRSLRAVFVVSC